MLPFPVISLFSIVFPLDWKASTPYAIEASIVMLFPSIVVLSELSKVTPYAVRLVVNLTSLSKTLLSSHPWPKMNPSTTLGPVTVMSFPTNVLLAAVVEENCPVD